MREQWVFGECYHLMVSDQSLDAVLRRHLESLGRAPAAMDLAPVRREDGSVGIVDLMLGRPVAAAAAVSTLSSSSRRQGSTSARRRPDRLRAAPRL
jgi:hypothetical protein